MPSYGTGTRTGPPIARQQHFLPVSSATSTNAMHAVFPYFVCDWVTNSTSGWTNTTVARGNGDMILRGDKEGTVCTVHTRALMCRVRCR